MLDKHINPDNVPTCPQCDYSERDYNPEEKCPECELEEFTKFHKSYFEMAFEALHYLYTGVEEYNDKVKRHKEIDFEELMNLIFANSDKAEAVSAFEKYIDEINNKTGF